MNVYTGEIIRYNPELTQKEMKKLFEQGFEPVPEKLYPAANAVLGESDRIIIDLAGDTPLAKWAEKKRNNTRRNKRKQEKAGRRANR